MEPQITPHQPARNLRFDKLSHLPGPQVTIEVDCIPDHHAAGGYCLQGGLNRITIFKTDLPVLQAQVRSEQDNADYELAKTSHARRLDTAIAKALVGIEKDQHEIDRITRRTKEEYSGSPEAVFYADFNRDLKPFASLKIVDDNVPPPRDEIAHQHTQAMASENAVAIATAVAAALKPLFEPLVAALQAAAGNTKSK